MKLVQTLVANKLKDIKTTKELFNNYHWGFDEDRQKTFWYTFIWSFMSGYKNCKNIHLFTDKMGAAIVNQLKLPYKKINVVLDDIDPRFWVFSKLKTYSLQNEPFLHYDIDVVFNKIFPNNALDYNLYYQNIFKFNFNSKSSEDMFFAADYLQASTFYSVLNYSIPKQLQELNHKNIDNHMFGNCGLFGGKDIKFIKEFSTNLLNEFLKLTPEQKDQLIQKIIDVGNKKILNNGINKPTTIFFSLLEEVYPNVLYYEKYGTHEGIGSFLQTSSPTFEERNKELQKLSLEYNYIHLMHLKSIERINATNKEIDNSTNMDSKTKYFYKINNNLDEAISNKVHELYPEQAKLIDTIFKS